MRVITHEFNDVSRSDKFRIYFIGDDHIGHPGVPEDRLKKLVRLIRNDESAYWVGMGDHIHAISKKDRRFDSDLLPAWMVENKSVAEIRKNLADIVSAQVNRYIDIVSPIAHKCLGVLQGNHEYTIKKHDERAVHGEIVDKLRVAGDFDPGHPLSLGYTGWLLLKFCRGSAGGKRAGVSTFKILTHHGASIAESRLKEYTLTSEADIVAWGHSHKLAVNPYRLRAIDKNGNLLDIVRWSTWTGTFQDDVVEGIDTWGEQKAHLKPLGCSVFTLRPYASYSERVRGNILLL